MTDLLTHTPSRPSPPEVLAAGVLVPAFVLMIVLGYALFAHGVGTIAGNELSRPASLLVAVNAATLTGFQQARNPGEYTTAGQVTTLTLMVGGTLFSLVGGGLAVVRIARLPYRDWTVATVAGACVVAAAAVGAVAGRGPGRSAFDGAFQAVSAFGNCGLFTGRLPAGGDGRTWWLLLPLAVLGSLGVPVLLDLSRGRASAHTRRVLTASAAVYLLSVATLVPTMAVRETVRATLAAVPSATSTASRLAVNARSAGFPFEFVTAVPAAAGVALFVTMAIGGAAGGTAGGVKVSTIAVVAEGTWAAVRGRPLGRAFGVAVGWVVVYGAAVLATATGLLLTDPELRADRVLFLAASGVGNVGLSHDPVSPSPAGMFVLSAAMLLGRVGPVVLLWTVADRMVDVTDPIG